LTDSLDSLISKIHAICKDLGDISYTRRVVFDFVLYFVVMATGRSW